MKVAILSAMWQRHRLFRIFAKQLKRFEEKYNISSLVVGSEGVASAKLCIDQEISYMEVPNKPLSNKFNAGSLYIHQRWDPDYLMILGSDDFLSDSLVETFLSLMEAGPDMIGMVDCYFYNAKIKELSYFQGYTNRRKGESLGMGRCLSRTVLNKLKGQLWLKNLNAGLDWSMTERLKKAGRIKKSEFYIKDTPHMAVDIKGFGNISDYGCYTKDMTEVPIETMNCLPDFLEIINL